MPSLPYQAQRTDGKSEARLLRSRLLSQFLSVALSRLRGVDPAQKRTAEGLLRQGMQG
jgi:hypothetical protein